MQDLEEIAINKLSVQSLFYFRYVDNVILTLPSDTTCSGIIVDLNVFSAT